jgi:CheY-like chemotaxis protein
MPVMSGEQSTQLIRQYEAENGLNRLVIIALSANVNTASSNKILDAGADGFVGKPVSMKGLDEGEYHVSNAKAMPI